MKRALKIVVIVSFVGFVVMQFFRPDLSNPQINDAETLEYSTQLPEKVGEILQRSCNDCHSNKTEYPIYSQVAPASWFLDDHIKEGRGELNFSVWNTYETKKKLHKLEEICEQVKSRMMPLPSYLWVHWSAKLSDEEIKILCDWAEGEGKQLAAANAQ